MMMVIFIICLIAFNAAIAFMVEGKVPEQSLGISLSTPAKQLLQEFEALPVDSRPDMDIRAVVRGLDERTETDSQAREDHFNENYNPTFHTRYESLGYKFTWSRCAGDRRNGACIFADYHRLHNEIASVQEVVTEKARVLADSQTEWLDADLAALTQSLRDGRVANETFVTKMKELS